MVYPVKKIGRQATATAIITVVAVWSAFLPKDNTAARARELLNRRETLRASATGRRRTRSVAAVGVMRTVVTRMKLLSSKHAETCSLKLARAGYRSNDAMIAFLFAKLAGPVVAGGPFERGQQAVAGYSFSDPRIVIAHFDPEHALLGRRMLLELRALRVLHYLSGVVVGAVQDERDEERSVFGFRYDTLEGHLEAGAEWFLLTKQHATGEIRFRIEASWRPGQFPNLWSRLGFYLLGPIYQEIWHRRAHAYLARLLRDPDAPAPEDGPGRLVHSPPKVVFERTRGKRGGVIGDW